MNRTGIFLAAAAVLALIALVVGLPQPRHNVAQPPPDVVKVSPAPAQVSDGSIKMSARLSHPYVGSGRSDLFVTIDLNGVDVPGATRSPVNLALVIDRSGSMSGFKLQQAKMAARQLVSQLKGADRLAIVHYGGDVKSMDGVFCTETNKEKLLRYIDNIWDEGGTNIGAGLTTGRDLLLASMSEFKVNRLVLISDGQPTEGIQDSGGLIEITRGIRGSGISVTSIGVGTDFNEDLMQGIAETGGGAYAFLQDAAQLASIFQKDLNQAATQVAHGVSLTFELPDGMELQEVLGYRLAYKDAKKATIHLPDFSAGMFERVVARVTVNAPGAGQGFDVTALKLDYMDLLQGSQVSSSAKLAAMTTDKADVIWSNRDKDATVYAARAQSAVNTQAAAEALKSGDRERAQKLMKENVFFFEEAAKVAGEGAVAQDKAEQKLWGDNFSNARTDEEVQAASKGAKRKARMDFGLQGSTY
ncbi:MAG: VWA domain-containing protein [Myxococcaceae bacterium]|nr:VWA domain-containing protein [Myxococcaceae bacterium]